MTRNRSASKSHATLMALICMAAIAMLPGTAEADIWDLFRPHTAPRLGPRNVGGVYFPNAQAPGGVRNAIDNRMRPPRDFETADQVRKDNIMAIELLLYLVAPEWAAASIPERLAITRGLTYTATTVAVGQAGSLARDGKLDGRTAALDGAFGGLGGLGKWAEAVNARVPVDGMAGYFGRSSGEIPNAALFAGAPESFVICAGVDPVGPGMRSVFDVSYPLQKSLLSKMGGLGDHIVLGEGYPALLGYEVAGATGNKVIRMKAIALNHARLDELGELGAPMTIMVPPGAPKLGGYFGLRWNELPPAMLSKVDGANTVLHDELLKRLAQGYSGRFSRLSFEDGWTAYTMWKKGDMSRFGSAWWLHDRVPRALYGISYTHDRLAHLTSAGWESMVPSALGQLGLSPGRRAAINAYRWYRGSQQ
jgi:hypothetical protein